MAKFRLQVGGEVDVLTKDELDSSLREHTAWVRELAFGLKHFELPQQSAVITAGGVTIGGSTIEGGIALGPKQGWVWLITRVTAAGFTSTADFLAIYKGDPGQPRNQVSTVGSGALLPGKGLLLKGGQYLTAAGGPPAGFGALTTANGTTIWLSGAAIEAPAPMIGKLLSI